MTSPKTVKTVAELAFRLGLTVGISCAGVIICAIFTVAAVVQGIPFLTALLFLSTILHARNSWHAWQAHKHGVEALSQKKETS